MDNQANLFAGSNHKNINKIKFLYTGINLPDTTAELKMLRGL
jgi:hypothetical protein